MPEIRTTKRFFVMALMAITVWLGQASFSDAQDRMSRAAKTSLVNTTKEPALISSSDNQNPVAEDKEGLTASRTTAVVGSDRTKSTSTPATDPAAALEGWQIEIRPYSWLAGIHGTVRVRNTTAAVGKDSEEILGMLDFAAAAQVEAIRGHWRLMLDENYVNLGTSGTGPLGNVTIDVQPTMNIFEFGGSYTAVSVPNKRATATDPLPPIFTAEILGGGRLFHLGVELTPNIGEAVDGSRNFIGPFVGNRFKVSPNKAVTVIGKYTVGGSGAGSNFAWSAEGLVDLRLKKGLSLSAGYRALGMNADRTTNTIGFNGQLRGLFFSATIYR